MPKASRKASKRQRSDGVSGASASNARVAGFTVLVVGSQTLYVKPHQSPSADPRTLFVANLPVDCTEAHLRSILARAGRIESVVWLDDKSRQIVEEGAEDSDEEVDDEAAPEDDGGDWALVGGGAQQKGKRGKKTKRAPTKPSGPPSVTPLPPLDPRHPHRLRSSSSTSARVIFLEQDSVDKALALSPLKSWPDPFAAVEAAKAAQEQERLEQDGSAPSGKSKKLPVTALEAAVASGKAAPPVGLAFLVARHAALRPPLLSVREHVDTSIARYAWLRENPRYGKKSGIKSVAVGPNGELLDEDGFTIVQKGGKYGRTTDASASEAPGSVGGFGASVRVARANATYGKDESKGAKKKKLELEDFYRFQRREKKRDNLAQLRARFEADKEKVARLQTGRRFKPF